MTVVAGNIASQYQMKSSPPKGDRLMLAGTIPIGGSGAVGTVVADDPAITATLNGTGDYTLAFPTSPTGRPGTLQVKSAAGTIKGWGTTAFDATAGTWRVILHNGAGTATQPASGDEIHFTVFLDPRG